ncbi:malate synthase A [Echinimonas agarilytica]|uniref:malate synthase n=1 Tax=Echinimonas agarilytica TaxID=1215918 RepID=A0AA41W6Z3_9GAMM|nr:malate synthase A [Echinimonas agarilytica]MCM2680165.1 malate synthase A [Echinimonas agarilytica]
MNIHRHALDIRAEVTQAQQEILSNEAMLFVADLEQLFGTSRLQLLEDRAERQSRMNAGERPDFLPETLHVRQSDWTIKGIPTDLLDRRVEITGPTDRKMVINALNANVKVFMADFEDALSPTWDQLLDGQINLRDANLGTIEYTSPDGQKHYSLNPAPALLICRVRGLHLPEKHVRLNGREISGSFFDFALYFIHNFKTLISNGSGPYFYLPKLQSYQEARLWNDVFKYTERRYGLPVGTIKATVLIETLPAVFEMDEILFELKDHIVALNCGRWDYIFSYIKTLQNHPDRVLPDRQGVTMDQPFLSAYSRLLVQTCHKRGAMAMGGMSAFIPSRDPLRNEWVLGKVRADKQLEASNGHDGTWVAHPGLADTAMQIFTDAFEHNNTHQLNVKRHDHEVVTADMLLAPCSGERTEEGMRSNIRVALQYIEAWLCGNGCVPIYGLMEDAATAEISRTSIWQWIRHGKTLSNGRLVTFELFQDMLAEELLVVRSEIGEQRFCNGRFAAAADLLERITSQDELEEFLTLPGYQLLD